MRLFRLVIGDEPQDTYVLNPDGVLMPERMGEQYDTLARAGARVKVEYVDLEWKDYIKS